MTWINLGQYAARLTEEMARASAVDPARITLETALEDVWVGLDIATPGGLIFWRSTEEDIQQATEVGAQLQTRRQTGTTAQRRSQARPRGRRPRGTR